MEGQESRLHAVRLEVHKNTDSYCAYRVHDAPYPVFLCLFFNTEPSISDIFTRWLESEVIPIDKKSPDWNRIKAEYVAGGISQRDLADKYGIPFGTMQKRARKGKWTEERTQAGEKVVEKVIQKTAKKTADNATLAADIKRKGLLLLDRLFDEFETVTATEHRDYTGRNLTDIKRLRDMTAAYKDLTDDMAKPEETENPLLRSLYDLMKENTDAD